MRVQPIMKLGRAKNIQDALTRALEAKGIEQGVSAEGKPMEIGGVVSDETYGDSYRTTERGWEIKQFLNDIKKGTVPKDFIHPAFGNLPCEVESYVILDDDRDMLPEQMENFIQCHPLYGFGFREYQQAVSILGEYKK